MPSDYPVTYKSKNIDKQSQILMDKLDLHIPMFITCFLISQNVLGNTVFIGGGRKGQRMTYTALPLSKPEEKL